VTLDAVGGADPGADFESVQIRVHDSGVGIPEEHLAMIFDRFSQGGNQRASEHAGSGIGLALVKELVVLHHGEINVKSEVGKGSEFDIMLPMGKAHLQPAELKDLSQVPVGSQKLIDLELAGMGVGESTGDASEDLQSIKADEDIMVLVIDDNADVRSFISMQLTGQFQIIEAENGREGARYARELLPDLIICDVMMPEMDGYELCRQIKNDPLVGHIPVIMLTAKAADEDRIKGLTYGADAYLTKPFNSQELQVRVMNLITGRRKLREKFKRDILQDPSEINRDSLEDQLLRKVRDLIDTRMSDPSFSIDDILNEMAISQRQFYRKIQALTGQTPGQFIRTMRLKRAMQLLKNKSGSVTQIAYDVGFSNLSYFSKCFREQFGRLPSEIGK
jgi:DNA-binding response OmpR family regulator